MKIVYLKPKSNFKSDLKSDTLWGLILNGIMILYSEDETNKLINEYKKGNPPFLISSAMPYILVNNEKICFFPKPIFKPFLFEATTPLVMTYYKDFKKIRSIPLVLFEKFINAEISEKEYFEQYIKEREKEKESKEKNKQYSLPIDFYNVNLRSEMVLHNTIDRLKNSTYEIDGEGQLFYTEEKFVKNGGLFFLLEGDIKLVESSLRLLQHLGMGGDNSVGKGNFEICIDDFKIRTPQNFNYYITLSLFSLLPEEVKNFKSNENFFWYNLIFRMGKANSKFLNTKEFQKDISPMLTEGSSFPIIDDKKYYGCIRTVLRNENIELFNYGYAFPVPAIWKEVN